MASDILFPHAPLVPPDALRRHFWDYEEGMPTGTHGDRTVVTRLLLDGGMDAVRWLRDAVGDEGLRQVLTERKGRGVSPKRLRFWGLVLDLPREQVDRWVAGARAHPWHGRTHS